MRIDFDRLFEAGNVAGIDDHLLPRGKLIFNKVAVNLGKSDAAARKLLHDEALAAKDAGLCLSIKMNAQLNTAFGSEERALLQNPAFVGTDLDRNDTAREARAKRDHGATVRGPDVLKHAFTRDGFRKHLAKPAARSRHLHVGGHPNHGTALGDHRFAIGKIARNNREGSSKDLVLHGMLLSFDVARHMGTDYYILLTIIENVPFISTPRRRPGVPNR